MDIQLAGFSLPNIKIFSCCLLALLFSIAMTWIVRLYAIHKEILDIPNERSSHHIPTPRGGGIAIVLTFILSILCLGYIGYIESSLVYALTGGGIAIAAIGYCDDIYSIKIRWRILVHFLAAIWSVYWLGGFIIVSSNTWAIPLHWGGSLLAIIGTVWCINLYNFMDGIDGLAGSEGIFISIGSGVALWLVGANQLSLVLWLLAASVTGFTIWNWPPAKIFLGDVGSVFLGFVFATLGLYTVNKGLLPFSFWWVISAIFLCDATFTLLCRMFQGKRWYSAHKEHAFQYLISYGANHKQVTRGILIFNICILLPTAYATLYWPTQSFLFTISSTLCLWLAWAWIRSLRAGNFTNNLEISPSSETTSTNY